MKSNYDVITSAEMDGETRCITLWFKGYGVRLDPMSAWWLGQSYGNNLDDWIGKSVKTSIQPPLHSVDIRPVKPPEQIAAEKLVASRVRVINNVGKV